MGVNPYFSNYDLWDHIDRGEFPSWTMYVQLIPEAEGEKYKYDIYDDTKTISHKDYPLIPFGKFVLNKNPVNYFCEVEQVAFAVSHMVPGIEPSNDKVLQGRLMSYSDAHRHRLGGNYE